MMRLDVLPLLDVLLSNIFLARACILLATSCKPNTGVHFIIVQQLVRVLMHSDTMHPNTTEINKQTNTGRGGRGRGRSRRPQCPRFSSFLYSALRSRIPSSGGACSKHPAGGRWARGRSRPSIAPVPVLRLDFFCASDFFKIVFFLPDLG